MRFRCAERHINRVLDREEIESQTFGKTKRKTNEN